MRLRPAPFPDRECDTCPPWVVLCCHLADDTLWILASSFEDPGHEGCTRTYMPTSNYTVARLTGYRRCMNCKTGRYGQLLADHTKKFYTQRPAALKKFYEGERLLVAHEGRQP